MDAPRSIATDGGASRDAHTRDQGTDQRCASAATTIRKQLVHPRGWPQAALWRLVLT